MYSFLGQYVYHSQFEWHVYACVMYSINVRYGKSNELIGVQIIITLNRGKIARHSQAQPDIPKLNNIQYTRVHVLHFGLAHNHTVPEPLAQRCEIKLLLTSKWWLLPTVFPFFYKQKWWHFEIQGMPLKPLSHIFTLLSPSSGLFQSFCGEFSSGVFWFHYNSIMWKQLNSLHDFIHSGMFQWLNSMVKLHAIMWLNKR